MITQNNSGGPSRVSFVGRYRHDRSVKMHWHPETELVLVLENTCVFEADGRFVSASPGEVAVLPAEVPHAQWSEGLTETRYCLFRSGSFAFDETLRVIRPFRDRLIDRWFEDLADLFASPGETSTAVADALLLAVIERLKCFEAGDDWRDTAHPALRRALDLIDRAFSDTLTVDMLADAAKVSPGHLRELFRRELRVSPNRYLQQVRLRVARDYLRNPYLNVSEVAYRCGFKDPNYFIRQFRREFGQSPGQWRQSPGVATDHTVRAPVQLRSPR